MGLISAARIPIRILIDHKNLSWDIRIRQGYLYPPRLSLSAEDIHVCRGYPYSLRISVSANGHPYLPMVPMVDEPSAGYPYLGQVDWFQDLKKTPCGSNSISKADCLWLQVPLVFFPTNWPVIGCCRFELHPTIIGSQWNWSSEAALGETQGSTFFPIHFSGWGESNENKSI